MACGLALGCVDRGPVVRVGVAARALAGVPVDGYPNYNERLMLTAINRVRADPNNAALGTESACSAMYPPQKPMMHDLDGAHAARFHALHTSINNGGLSHNSYCTLRSDVGTSGCDGHDACACMPGTSCYSCTTLGGCGTDPFTRASYFGFPSMGEVGAVGDADGFDAVTTWAGECAGQDGHRSILVNGGFDTIGLGFAAGDRCWSTFFFGDVASRGVATAVLPSGAHRGSGAGVDFYVSYASAEPAASVQVVIDGVCHSMAIELGTPMNATFKASAAAPSGCHEYWFVAKDSAGTRSIYPEQGSYAFGEGCADDYRTTAMPADCEGAHPMPDSGVMPPPHDGGPIAGDAAPTADDSGMMPPPPPPADAGRAIDDAGPIAGRDAGGSGGVHGSTGCTCVRRDGPSSAIFSTLVLIALFRRRRIQ